MRLVVISNKTQIVCDASKQRSKLIGGDELGPDFKHVVLGELG